MNPEVAAAQDALQAGRRDEAIELLMRALSGPASPAADVWLLLARQLYFAGRLADADRWTARALEQHGLSYELWNIRGVVLRMLKRPAEALEALDRAIALKPEETIARINRVHVLLDIGERDEAARRLREILTVKPDYIDGWLHLAGLSTEAPDVALVILDDAMTANPGHPKLHAARALVLRNAGRRAELVAWLEDLARRYPDQAWPPFDLGHLLLTTDPVQAVAMLRRALALEPTVDHQLGLATALCQWGTGGSDALEEAWRLCQAVVRNDRISVEQAMVLREIFTRVLALDEIDKLGDPAHLAQVHLLEGQRSPQLWQMVEVRTDDDRLQLVAQHRAWGDVAQRQAEKTPIRRSQAGRSRDKLRVGLLSSDLRNHPVGRFAAPVFEHFDPDRFELFAYSFHPGAADETQTRLTGLATAYNSWPDITSREAAERIADDRLDMLIELGGPTGLNRPEVMAWRPAPIQASWLGYPHSVGLTAIDYLICDPHNAPTQSEMMIERPLILPASWIALSDYYSDRWRIAAETPEDRAGVITFGTANAPYKFNRATLAAWAQTLLAVPGSRFAFLRPEAGTPVFRTNVVALFGALGVAADRLVFHPTRGDLMELYNELDISLDPFPLTGGTTTADSLWMGVPVVSLAGPSFYERLSRSMLINAGLRDLCVGTVDDYVRTAVALADDRPRRAALRHALRSRLRASPLGQPEAFARDFYDLITKTVSASREPR